MLCVYCKKFEANGDKAVWPFCSVRCKALDLGAWAEGKYRVAGAEVGETESPITEDDDDSEISKQ